MPLQKESKKKIINTIKGNKRGSFLNNALKENSKIIITSALPYANGPIHIGHLVEYIQTDIFVRFLRLTGKNVVYCCADDTHGTPVQISAEKEGIIPEELIGRYHQEHLRDFKKFLIGFDSYYSTNSQENKYFSDLIFGRLKKKNLVYKKEVELAYCNKCRKFLPDRYIKGKCPKCNAPEQYGDVCEQCNSTYKTIELIEPYCTICGGAPIRKPSRHYFFRLSKFSGELKRWFNKNKNLQPEVINYLERWIDEGLQDWDISRDGPYFGFRIPDEENLYYYVWLDAPIGYISSFANALKGDAEKRDAKKAENEWNKSRIIHFIGKDIIYFHFLFWPAVLMGAEFALPDYLVVHGFLTVNKQKMSKSRGTFFTAEEFSNKYNPEYLRFYYARVLSRRLADIDLDFKELRECINNELAGNLGNFCYRVLSFANKFFNSRIGKLELKEVQEDKKLISEIESRVEKVREGYEGIDYNAALKEILAISDLGNRYFQKNEPWKLIKSPDKADKEKARRIVGLCVNIVRNLSILTYPILPNFSKRIQEQLNLQKNLQKPQDLKRGDLKEGDLELQDSGLLGLKLQDLKLQDLRWEDIGFGYQNKKLGKAEIIIEKIEDEANEGNVEGNAEFPLDLRIAKIEKAEEHPQADKLYILTVDLGQDSRQGLGQDFREGGKAGLGELNSGEGCRKKRQIRQIVAGLKGFYSKKELEGKNVIVVANLEPSKLRGVVSDGMLLAAEKDGKCVILSPQGSPGEEIRFGSLKNSARQINFEQFSMVKMEVKNHRVVYNGKALNIKGREVKVELEDGADIC